MTNVQCFYLRLVIVQILFFKLEIPRDKQQRDKSWQTQIRPCGLRGLFKGWLLKPAVSREEYYFGESNWWEKDVTSLKHCLSNLKIAAELWRHSAHFSLVCFSLSAQPYSINSVLPFTISWSHSSRRNNNWPQTKKTKAIAASQNLICQVLPLPRLTTSQLNSSSKRLNGIEKSKIPE